MGFGIEAKAQCPSHSRVIPMAVASAAATSQAGAAI